VIWQRDTYFWCPAGRLKLREERPGSPQLIQYNREDCPGDRVSEFRVAEVVDPGALRDTLEHALGVKVVVEKERRLFLWKTVRIHLDGVVGLALPRIRGGRLRELRCDIGVRACPATAQALWNQPTGPFAPPQDVSLRVKVDLRKEVRLVLPAVRQQKRSAPLTLGMCRPLTSFGEQMRSIRRYAWRRKRRRWLKGARGRPRQTLVGKPRRASNDRHQVPTVTGSARGRGRCIFEAPQKPS
jgi:hypothetical protein